MLELNFERKKKVEEFIRAAQKNELNPEIPN